MSVNKIKKVLLCGLGGVGTIYADLISKNNEIDFKILVDKNRLERYQKEPRYLNNKMCEFDYITHENTNFKADLIIIATKYNALKQILPQLKIFISTNTILISLLNGITSEQDILKLYPNINIVYSYVIGHTMFRKDNFITHDGVAKIIYGSNNIEINNDLMNFFNDVNIKYELKENIIQEQWCKYAFNCCVNQLSAITRKTFKELEDSDSCMRIMKLMTNEITLLAEKELGKKIDFWNNTKKFLKLMIPNGKTSMLQDIENGKKPEIDIFSKTVIELSKKHNLKVPYNDCIYYLLTLL